MPLKRLMVANLRRNHFGSLKTATTLAAGPTLIKRGQAGVLRESRLG